MGVINVKISDETESKFRMELLRRFSSKKGVMGKQVDLALKNWIYRPVWVQDIENEKVEGYIQYSESINKKLRYFSGEPLKTRKDGSVGMYYRLRNNVEP